jgi:hypothetical protein
MDIGPTLVADGEPAEAIEPGQRAFHHPAMAPQALAGVDRLAGNADLDVAFRQRLPAARDVIGFVGMPLVRPLTPTAVGLANPGHGVEEGLEDDRIVTIGPRQEGGERQPTPLGQNMPFGAAFAAVGRAWSREVAPLLAGMEAESMQARLQSIWPASPSRSSNVWCKASHTPVACQSRNRRQQVIPEPQPISWGSSSHWMPVLRTKMMPVRQARSGTRGRPPLGLGGSAGSSGETSAHNSSLTKGVLILQVCHTAPVLLGTLSPSPCRRERDFLSRGQRFSFICGGRQRVG